MVIDAKMLEIILELTVIMKLFIISVELESY
jgi:hypothetical protein